jgi:hypothetical protein
MAIFNTNRSVSNEDKFYCLLGSEDYIDDDGYPRLNNENMLNAVAKIIFSKKPKHFTDNDKSYGRYYIKLDPNSKIFNPKKILSSIEEKNSLSFINNICKSEWDFKEVTPQVFQKYITFLKTKNLSWLKDAQRDLK